LNNPRKSLKSMKQVIDVMGRLKY